MATYAIGDVQGCAVTLERLLRRIHWNRRRDRLWLAGDLVNRGPGSLEVLRFAARQGDRVVAVLGNHDLHLLMVAAGLRESRDGDTLGAILGAPDRRRLLSWLRGRPLVHREGSFLLVHGGLWPTWTASDAVRLSAQAQVAMRHGDSLLHELAVNRSLTAWRPGLRGLGRLAVAVRLMTMLRMIDKDGLPVKFSGSPDQAPDGAMPWYAAPGRRSRASTVLFGHWAAHDFALKRRTIALDSGCVWGRRLTAVRLDDLRVFQEEAADGAAED